MIGDFCIKSASGLMPDSIFARRRESSILVAPSVPRLASCCMTGLWHTVWTCWGHQLVRHFPTLLVQGQTLGTLYKQIRKTKCHWHLLAIASKRANVDWNQVEANLSCVAWPQNLDPLKYTSVVGLAITAVSCAGDPSSTSPGCRMLQARAHGSTFEWLRRTFFTTSLQTQSFA